jgi:hypothetical protein
MDGTEFAVGFVALGGKESFSGIEPAETALLSDTDGTFD